jgi:hypothetical protein
VQVFVRVVTLVLVAVGACGGDGQSGSGPCRSTDDCALAAICFAPGATIRCGNDPGAVACTDDSGCPTGQICDRNDCEGGAQQCFPGCTSDAGCGEGEICGATGHCEPRPCSASAGDCPIGFACDEGAAVCQRVSCTGDGDCPSSTVCVTSGCYSGPGQCGLID